MIQPHFDKFRGELLSEPSGVAQLPDGCFIVVNDTHPNKALFVLEMKNNGKLRAKMLDFPDSPKLNDLEGVVLIGNHIYAVSSHAENNNSTRRVVRFMIRGDRVRQMRKARGSGLVKKRVKQALMLKHPQLKNSDFDGDEFNIEGFAAYGNEFLLGLRSPLMNNLALIVKINGLSNSFGNNGSKYGVSTDFDPLYLKGGGIRAMSYIPDLEGYLIVSGKSVSGTSEFPCALANMDSKFLLWFWDGENPCKELLCFKKKQGGVKLQPEGITA